MISLFDPYEIKGLELRNRLVMAPMCQYSATDGIPEEWHFTHYTSRAVGGTGLILIEMTNVEARGRITDHCLGIWSDGHVPHYKRIVDACHRHGAKVGIQLAHAGRKARDTELPVSSSSIAYSDDFKTPHELSTEEVEEVIDAFRWGAKRSVEAGFDTIELHAAHGYLIHQFQSHRTNTRTDEYGQDLSLFGRKVIEAVKSVMPEEMPLILRISAVEFAEDGYDLDHAVWLSKQYIEAGVDMIDVSAGGEGKPAEDRFPGAYPGYMVPYAKTIHEETGIPVMAVGLLDDVNLAEHVVASEEADLVAIGRGLLRDPYWVLNASRQKKEKSRSFIPEQYERAY
ncbi:NADH:flavin oxidoreductase/NADH oxidase [Salinicoccus sp. ID82-1]|uniref:NADH:flavin oxidoreductase/NADH oxidase n=1 Tax=Salinicoccus sp. ID82-1 TaxID=2820269 RepID=UPI001F2A862A|nr:NADH:flavin oxidoreductase/NADH oxidase [Salinicoccus sp. ID82-1]MCG1009865.1 NADH:flavin oxidoreductase/NADH oxidase [Salinicoccus sp. ID82-1]